MRDGLCSCTVNMDLGALLGRRACTCCRCVCEVCRGSVCEKERKRWLGTHLEEQARSGPRIYNQVTGLSLSTTSRTTRLVSSVRKLNRAP
jgi:hypothetical protein